MTQEEINEIKAIIREVMREDGVLIDDDTAFPVTDNPGDNALAWYMTQGTQGEQSSFGRTPLKDDGREPTNIQWSSSSCNATIGATNTFPTLDGASGLTITYSSSNHSVATVNASGVVTLVGAGTCIITASFAGNEDYKPSSDTYTLTVADTPHLPVQVGHGTDYANAKSNGFGNVGAPLSNNMIVTIPTNADYIFVKIDKRDTLNNLYTYPGPNMSSFEYSIGLVYGGVDGDYKYYRSDITIKAGTKQYKLNRV